MDNHFYIIWIISFLNLFDLSILFNLGMDPRNSYSADAVIIGTFMCILIYNASESHCAHRFSKQGEGEYWAICYKL